MSRQRLLLITALSLTLMACATGPTQPPPVESRSPSPSATPPADAPAPSVTVALREESRRAAEAGDLARAAAVLERAIRIEPGNGELWLDLAKVRLREGNAEAAEQLARKAVSLVEGQYRLEQEAYSVIDTARRQR